MESVTVAPKIDWGRPRKLSFEQARQEQRDYDNTLTMVQRLETMDDWNRQLIQLRGLDPDELAKDNTVCRIRRIQG